MSVLGKGNESISFNRIMESPAYLEQRAVIKNEVNSLKQANGVRGYALPRFAEPGRLHCTDYRLFKQSQQEKVDVKNAKLSWRKAMKQKHGKQWTKHTACMKQYLEINTHI